jgi:hypothetical protein
MNVKLLDDYRLTFFENKVVRRIFGCKKEDAIKGRRKLRDKKFLNSYFPPNYEKVVRSKRIRWA